MGYSERYCHICGVSFNIGRTRTKDEPRSHAWYQIRSHDRDHSSFVDGGRNSHIGECGRDAGCMLAYREDVGARLERRHAIKRGQDGETGDGEVSSEDRIEDEANDRDDMDFVPNPKIMEKLRSDAAFNMTGNASTFQKMNGLVQNIFGGDMTDLGHDASSAKDRNANNAALLDDNHTDISMEYEYESPPETCDEYSENLEDDWMGSSSEDEEENCYRNFKRSLNQPDAADPTRNTKEEIVLPLFRPLEDNNQDVVSTHGSEASFEYYGEEDSHEQSSEKLDHWISGKLSHYHHPLSKTLKSHYRDQVWEHIAGPGCLNLHGYNGARISNEEMLFANTLQCLIQKIDAGREGMDDDVSPQKWEPDPDDEPWEDEAAWFLSGVSDFMPSRDMDDPRVFPQRHGRHSINAENVCWGPDMNNDDPRYAMPFHPACFEIYKRAAIGKYGVFNVDLLGSWWRLKSRYDEFHHTFPRSEAVREGMEQSWKHTPGHEYLAADPLFLPGLRDAINSADLEDVWSSEGVSTGFSSLPAEITEHTLEDLDTVNVAKASLAIPALRPVARQILRKRLQEHSHLWELEPSRPYSKWTGVTAWELQIVQKEFDRKQSEIGPLLEVLKQEGCDEAHDDLKQYCEQQLEARRNATIGVVLREKSPLQIPDDEVGIARFAIALEEASKSGKLKGLQNRQRIWKDCETILEQIEDLQKQGDILSSGQVRPGAKLYEHDE